MDFAQQVHNFPVGFPYSLQDPVFPYRGEIPYVLEPLISKERLDRASYCLPDYFVEAREI